ncbi:Txe/YoeB family addiction module toxin [Arthrobacter sp. PAMC25284]|uniref:Txe/YoeB family addiction module toxin n=1 Tax=Arthrobacter sp. PAMC25284 TaxID=2861279 RepID=UPI0035BEE561
MNEHPLHRQGVAGQRLLNRQRDPFDGIGKPEALKHQLSGYWSRRINDEHRLVYAAEPDQLVIIAARHHY